MIVKVRTNDSGWEYFNCPKGVKVRKLTREQRDYVWSDRDSHYIILQLDNILDQQLTLINIYDNQKIYTSDIAYLLNDNGKTIEKLN